MNLLFCEPNSCDSYIIILCERLARGHSAKSGNKCLAFMISDGLRLQGCMAGFNYIFVNYIKGRIRESKIF